MVVYRIADGRRAIFDPTGAMLRGGRWNSVGRRVIYAAETYAGALLEILVHANMQQVPRHDRLVRITVPDEVVVETLAVDDLPGWADEDMLASSRFGDQWIDEGRTAVLRVPSVVTNGREHNIVFNPDHRDFALISASATEAISWDARLFGPRVSGISSVARPG